MTWNSPRLTAFQAEVTHLRWRRLRKWASHIRTRVSMWVRILEDERRAVSEIRWLGIARTGRAQGWDRWTLQDYWAAQSVGQRGYGSKFTAQGDGKRGKMKPLCGQISETDLGLGNRASMCNSEQENKHGLKPGVISFFCEELIITCFCIEGHKVPITTIWPHHCRAKTATGLGRAGF